MPSCLDQVQHNFGLFFSNFSAILPILPAMITQRPIYYIALILGMMSIVLGLGTAAGAGECIVTSAAATGSGSLSAAIDQATRGQCRVALDEASRRRYEAYVPVTPTVHLIRIPKSAVIAVSQALSELHGVNHETVILQVASGATVQISGSSYTDTQAPLRISGTDGNVIVDGIGLQNFAQTAMQIDGRDHLVMAAQIAQSGSATAPALRISGTHIIVAESTFSQNRGDAIRVEDCQGSRVKIIKTTIANTAGVGIRVRAAAVEVHDNNIYLNQGAAVRVDDRAAVCSDASEGCFTAELRRNKIYHNPEGVVITRDELVPPVDLIEVSAPTSTSYRIIGNIGRNAIAGYPWDDAHLNLKDAVVDIFLADSTDTRQGMVYIASTTVFDVAQRLFIATIPKPLVIDGKEIKTPIFVATLTDPEHHNSSRYSDALDVEVTRDWDRDGIPNHVEDANQDGTVNGRSGETNPRLQDSDGDGLTDGTELLHRAGFEEMLRKAIEAEKLRKEEKLIHDHVVTAKVPIKDLNHLNPTSADSDEDCLPDGLELGVVSFEFPAVSKAQYSALQAPALVLSSGCLEILKAHQLYQVDLSAPEKGTLGIKNILLRDTATPATLANVIGIYDMDPSTQSDPTTKDTDNDRVMDGAEDWNWDGVRSERPLTPALSQGEREWAETDPNTADSDKDGLIDGDEDRNGNSIVDKDETSPLLADSDHDGVADAQEVKSGANPMHCDSDGDGEPDGIENNISNENAPAGCPGAPAGGTNFANPFVLSSSKVDSDSDGLKDGDEDKNHNGWLDPMESDPTTSDTDGDDITDDVETTGDTDHDGVADFFVGDIDNGGKCAPPMALNDTDCDGLANAQDADSDNDGCPDRSEGITSSNTAHNIPAAYTRESKQCNGHNGGGSSAGASPKPSNGNGNNNASGSKPAEGGATDQTSGSGVTKCDTKDGKTYCTSEPVGNWNAYWAERTDGGGACSLLPQNDGQPPNFPLFLLAGLLLGVLVTARTYYRVNS